jgi:nicotinamidase/pyrazinamidase
MGGQIPGAMIIVDLQNDFLPGGTLPVPRSDEIIPAIKRYLEHLSMPVYATRDWHPHDHRSFIPQGGPWPPHCISGTHGAEFALQLPDTTQVISKATKKDEEAYSGFCGTNLDQLLRNANISKLYVCGLATEYCVLETVKDALNLGYRVVLLEDAMRAVDPLEGEQAISEMIRRGASVVFCS